MARQIFQRNFILPALVLIVVAFAVACGDDDDGEGGSELEIQEVEDLARQLVGSSGEDAEFFFAHVTDNLLTTVLFAERAECEAAPVECIGEPLPVESISGTEIDGDTARTMIVSDFGVFEMRLVRDEGVWKGDSFSAASDEVPDGATVVELGLSEFHFLFDESAIPSDGNFAFDVTNFGNQVHEVVVLSVPDGGDLESAIGDVESEEVPPVALKIYIQSGQELQMAFDEPLGTGDYALVCFFPDTDDPEFAAHIAKGMVAEFAVR